MESLKNKTAVITGVGSGFGKATAELFAAKDQCNLVLIDIDKEALDATVKVCTDAGSQVASLAGDVTKLATFTWALETALKNFGTVDFLINFAGGAVKWAMVEELDDETNRKIIDLNLTSTIMSCRTFMTHFKEQRGGKIINVSSVCDRRSWPGYSVYSAAKAGIREFSRCLYTEVRPFGVAVTTLVPGGSNTGFQKADGLSKFEWDEELAVRPEHFADAVYCICALSKGACVSELCLYGLAQDICGF
ncbi:MAG: SDR family oxidoreductase [Sphaerochaeta sp.]|jgi:NAD(P)-dependent dehydrogenase (short-subunit alcohol dehydrogenase family)|nr:SDR family oxidoreductase [Sphaerochaeta sp.]MDX9914509.1 SDR family oxidoreductase [Sphaerochaeta sp.]